MSASRPDASAWRDAVRLRVVELGGRLLGDGCLVLPRDGAPDVVFEVTSSPELTITLDGETMPRWAILDLLNRPGPVGLFLRELHGITPDTLPERRGNRHPTDTLTAAETELVKAIVAEHGRKGALQALGLSSAETLTKLVAGQPVARMTAETVRTKLGEQQERGAA